MGFFWSFRLQDPWSCRYMQRWSPFLQAHHSVYLLNWTDFSAENAATIVLESAACALVSTYLGLALMALITILCVILNFRAWEPFCDLPSETPHGGGWCYSRDLGEEFAYSYVFTVIIRILVTDPLVLFLKVLAFRIFFRSDDGSCKYKIIGLFYACDHMAERDMQDPKGVRATARDLAPKAITDADELLMQSVEEIIC